ncbi:MAG: ribose 5-phosphate isomerase B [Candidatus Diapherotrites archaeon]
MARVLAFEKVVIACDHAGFALKERLKRALSKAGIEFEDLGTQGKEDVDYPDYAQKAAGWVAKGRNIAGILICGSGIGMCISANRCRGVRAAACWNVKIAKIAREHNNANVLCLGARVLKANEAEKIMLAFLATGFCNEERHLRRISKIESQGAMG